LSKIKREKIRKVRMGKRIKPPKKWFYKTLAKVERYKDTITTPEKVVGNIWYRLPKRKQIEILKRR
jgi:hypothetical protein